MSHDAQCVIMPNGKLTCVLDKLKGDGKPINKHLRTSYEIDVHGNTLYVVKHFVNKQANITHKIRAKGSYDGDRKITWEGLRTKLEKGEDLIFKDFAWTKLGR